MDGHYYCGQPDALATGTLKRAPQARWWLDGELSRISRAEMLGPLQAAFDGWSAVADVTGTMAQSASEADLIVRVHRLDGASGVLADCELPGPTQQRMRLDDSEQWVVHVGAGVAAGAVDLYRVLLHELGHFWGLGHAPQGSDNLMAPTYSRQIWTPRSWETAEMQARYGAPKPRTRPAPAPDLPAEMWVVGTSKRVIAKYKLTRID